MCGRERSLEYGQYWCERGSLATTTLDRKSTRLNSSHLGISYAVLCFKKKTSSTDAGRISLRLAGFSTNCSRSRASASTSLDGKRSAFCSCSRISSVHTFLVVLISKTE